MLLRMEGITKVYQTGEVEVRALDDVNLEVGQGEFVSIMGPSGSGKTTLMNIIGCLDRPTSGRYWLQDEEVEEMNDAQLAAVRNRRIGFVFQSFNLLPMMTAVQNVELPLLYGNGGNRHGRAQEALDEVGLSHRAHHRPTELSGGQQQRVAIARALVTDPAIILADEPTGNLDTETGAEILELFSDLHERGGTIVTVTHDPRVADCSHRLVRFIDGKIISDESSGGQCAEDGEIDA